jgi:hypothetical protein
MKNAKWKTPIFFFARFEKVRAQSHQKFPHVCVFGICGGTLKPLTHAKLTQWLPATTTTPPPPLFAVEKILGGFAGSASCCL